jgi:hypothetical protein
MPAAIVPSCDPLSALRRIAQACRDRLLGTLRRENSLLPELGPQLRDLLLAELPKGGPWAIQPWQVDLLLHTASRYRAGTAELLHEVSVNSKRRSFMSSASLTFSWAPFRGKTVCAWRYSFSEGIRLADATNQNITLQIETGTSEEFAEDVLQDSIRPAVSAVVSLVRACLDAHRHGTQVPAFLTDPCSAASAYGFYLEVLAFPELNAVLIDVVHPYRRVFLCTPHFVAELNGTLANRARALPPASLCSAVLNSLGARSAAKLVEQEGARVWDLAAPKIAARALRDTAATA